MGIEKAERILGIPTAPIVPILPEEPQHEEVKISCWRKYFCCCLGSTRKLLGRTKNESPVVPNKTISVASVILKTGQETPKAKTPTASDSSSDSVGSEGSVDGTTSRAVSLGKYIFDMHGKEYGGFLIAYANIFLGGGISYEDELAYKERIEKAKGETEDLWNRMILLVGNLRSGGVDSLNPIEKDIIKTCSQPSEIYPDGLTKPFTVGMVESIGGGWGALRLLPLPQHDKEDIAVIGKEEFQKISEATRWLVEIVKRINAEEGVRESPVRNLEIGTLEI